MALRELSSTFYRLSVRDVRPSTASISRNYRRYASGEAAAESSLRQEISEDLQELELTSSYSPTDIPAAKIEAFDPVKRAQSRKRQLPPSRYINLEAGYFRRPGMLIQSPGTNINLQDTTEVLSILTNLPHPPILPHDSSSLALSPTLASSKPTNPPSRQTLWQ